jgi:hypothetical protein
MKRQILRIGRSSLAVSLPKQYVTENNLSSGEEIDVQNHGRSLEITCDNSSIVSKTIDLRGLSINKSIDRLYDKVLGALFRQGIDNITIICGDEDKADLLRNLLRKGKLNMYEDPEIENPNIVHIHSSITKFDDGAVNKMIEAIIKQIYSLFDEFIDDLHANKLDEIKTEKLMMRDRIINEQTDICKRIINKNVTNYESTAMYNFVDRLEKIGDALKELIFYSKLNKSSAKDYQLMITGLRDAIYVLFTSYNKFSIKKVNDFYGRLDVWEPIQISGSEKILYFYCQLILRLIRNAYSNLIVMKL